MRYSIVSTRIYLRHHYWLQWVLFSIYNVLGPDHDVIEQSCECQDSLDHIDNCIWLQLMRTGSRSKFEMRDSHVGSKCGIADKDASIGLLHPEP